MDAEIESLRSGLARLQATLFILFALLAVVIALLHFASSSSSQVVNAIAFRLVDADGNVRAELVTRGGHPGLYLRDENGLERVAIFHDAETSGVFINDKEAHTRIGVAQFSHGGGGVALHGPKSKGAAVLYLKNEGSLRFFDANGTVTNEVGATPVPN